GAKDAPGRVPEALANPVKLAHVVDRANAAPQPQAATEPASAPGIGNERIFFHPQGIFHFDGLHWQIGGVGDVHLDAVLAIAVAATAHSATQRLEVYVRRAAPRIDTSKHHAGVGAVGGAYGPFRQHVRKGTNHDIDDPLAGVGAKGDGGG